MKHLPLALRAAFLGTALLATAGLVAASAQEQDFGRHGRVGRTATAVKTHAGAACPTIEWHLAPTKSGGVVSLNGVAFYSDMSGISVINGSIGADGKIAAVLTSVNGNGPVGTVAGLRTSKEAKGELTGTGCANAKFDMLLWATGPSEGS